MNMKYNGDGWWLEVEREYVDVTAALKPDPHWTYTDPAGHVHTYDEDMEVPTAEEVWEEHWCVLCHDTYRHYDFVCRRCGALVHPGTKRDREVGHMARPVSIRGEVTDMVECFEELAGTMETGNAVDVKLGEWDIGGAWVTAIRAHKSPVEEQTCASFRAATIAPTPDPFANNG